MHIKFLPATDETHLFVPHPKPAKEYIPDWYKDVKPNYNRTLALNNMLPDGQTELNFKHCAPFLDSFISGYIQETWTDISFETLDDGKKIYAFASGPTIMGARRATDVKLSESFYNTEYTWSVNWTPVLPKGWSMLITHPFNRIDLPFFTLSGIIDFDHFTQTFSGNLPFFVQKDFNGIIPSGTPMFQMIPIKRENWTSSIEKHEKEFWAKNFAIKNKHFYDGYKKLFWQKKNYK